MPFRERYDLIRKERELEWWEYEWKDLYDFPGYEIATFGVIRNKKTKKELKLCKNVGRGGYLYVLLRKPKSRKQYKVYISRQVAIAFLLDEDYSGNDNRIEVDHLDEDKTNNNDWNLEWVTPKENKYKYWKSRKKEMN
jgi:hypothetical protein